ncbi:MAG TPA: HAD-IIB family hydrolase [Candidatus Saccharimonadia bacterium]|jgi:hypothetical protein
MSSNTYQALVFDLDGTAIPNSPQGMPSARLKAAIAAARDRVHLIAATTRPFRFALPVVKALGLTDPCVVGGGTTIISPSGEILRRTVIPQAVVKSILDTLKEYPYDVSIGDQFDDTGHPTSIPTLDDVDIIFVAPVSDHDVLLLRKHIEPLHDLSFIVAPSWTAGMHAVTLTHKTATKEHAIREILQKLSIDSSRAIGVGDGDNDIHLFAAVGHRIAMGNATAQLKSIADETAPTIDDDGLASIIEKYCLTEGKDHV